MAVVETLELRFQANMGNLAEQIGQIASRLGSLGEAADAAVRGFGEVSAAANGLLQGIAAGLDGTLIAQAGELGAGIAQALLGGMSAAMIGGREPLAAEARNLVAGVSEGMIGAAGMSSAPASAGNQLTQRFSGAILAGRTAAASAAKSVVQAANFHNSAAVSAATSAGANLSKGFANGIASQIGAVVSAAQRVVNAAVSKIKSGLQISSPSKVTFDLGGFFGEGFANGIRASLKEAQASAAALASGAVEAVSPRATAAAAESMESAGLAGMMRGAVDEALGGTSFVIPLYVDGVKLGEASIRGINRVTRSTGRLMLEI